MDHYDDDEDNNVVTRALGGESLDVLPEDDPYMAGGAGGEDSGSDAEDMEIKPSDLVRAGGWSSGLAR